MTLRQVSPSEWASTEVLGYGSSYDVVADGKDAKGRTTEAKFTLTTIAPATTAYANLIPAPGAVRGTGVGIGQPIVFQFTHPVTNKAEVQKHLRISNNGEFVHENPDSVSAQGGSNVSHGCININQANAQWFFGHLGLGDVVEVSNSRGHALPVWDLYGDWSLPWATWQTGNATS